MDYSRLEDGEAFILELVTPFVLRSEYPTANNLNVPWWWSVKYLGVKPRGFTVLGQHRALM